jgi:hypothetical protein
MKSEEGRRKNGDGKKFNGAWMKWKAPFRRERGTGSSRDGSFLLMKGDGRRKKGAELGRKWSGKKENGSGRRESEAFLQFNESFIKQDEAVSRAMRILLGFLGGEMSIDGGGEAGEGVVSFRCGVG